MSRFPSDDDLRSLAGMERRLWQQSEEISLLRQQIGDGLEARISALERTLAEHTNLLAALRQKAMDSDCYMQRLITTVERLCMPHPGEAEASSDEAPEPHAEPSKPSAPDLPFHAQLKDAIERVAEFQPRIVPASHKPRSVE